MAGAAIGRFGGAGQDLIAYARTPCQTTSPGGDQLVVVDLRNGASRGVIDVAPGTTASAALGPWIPLVVDLDGDGIDEAIVRQANRVVVVDPGQDWRVEELAVDAIPLAVTRQIEPDVVALYRPVDTRGDPVVDLQAIGRTRSGRKLTHREGVPDRRIGSVASSPCAESTCRPIHGCRRRPGSATSTARAVSTSSCRERPSSIVPARPGPGGRGAGRPGR